MIFCLKMDWDFFNQYLIIPLNYKNCFSEHCFLEAFLLLLSQYLECVSPESAKVYWFELDHSRVLCWVLVKKQALEQVFFSREIWLTQNQWKSSHWLCWHQDLKWQMFPFLKEAFVEKSGNSTCLYLPSLSCPTGAAEITGMQWKS